jgi:hypothetical protein
MQSIKKSYLIIAAIICVIGFITPFIIKSPNDTWNTVLSSAFTILSSVITIAAFIIAILLFDRFGINAKFKQKQIDEVLELASYLKNTNIHAKNSTFTYIIHRNQLSITSLNEYEEYKKDRGKTILLSNDFLDFFSTLYVFTTKEWLPQEIKKKLEFINIKATEEVEKPEKGIFILMFIDKVEDDHIWRRTIPKLTFEMFNINLSALLREVDFWLKNHSDVHIKMFP